MHFALLKHGFFNQNKGEKPFRRQCSGVKCTVRIPVIASPRERSETAGFVVEFARVYPFCAGSRGPHVSSCGYGMSEDPSLAKTQEDRGAGILKPPPRCKTLPVLALWDITTVCFFGGWSQVPACLVGNGFGVPCLELVSQTPRQDQYPE